MDWKSKLSAVEPKKQQFFVMLLVGILLVVVALPSQEDDKPKEAAEEKRAQETENMVDYEEKMEKKLVKILEQVAGVGEVEVMITLKSTSEKVIEKDQESSENSRGETTVYTDERENPKPYVKKEMTPEMGGIVVIAQGGGNPVTVQNITQAIQALFDVDTHKIKIMKMNQRK